MAAPRETNVSEGGIACIELGIAVRGHIDAVVSPPAGSVRERKRNVSYLVIPVVTGVS